MTDTPIVVNANPQQDQLEALVRQIITVLGAGAGVYGLTTLQSKLGLLMALSGPIATLIAMAWGLIKTGALAAKAAAMANKLSNSVAIAK